MPTTPRHAFQKWSAGFTQSDTLLNTDLDMLDVRVGLSVRSRTENAPLGGDVAGDCYIITAAPSGAFSTFTQHYVAWYNGTTWYEFAPVTGQVAWVEDDAEGVTFDGAAWTVTSGVSLQNVVEDTTPQLGGALDVNGQKIVSVSDGNIDIEPHGTGNVLLGNFVVDADATIGAGQDNYVLTYDHASGTWGPEPTGESGASTTQTAEMIAGFIGTPSDKDYRIVVKMAHGGTVTETTTRSASGTCTATFKVNTTALGGTANSVSSAEQSQAHASTNTFVAGDDIVITVSANSSCADMSFSIKYTRTLE